MMLGAASNPVSNSNGPCEGGASSGAGAGAPLVYEGGSTPENLNQHERVLGYL